MNRSRRGVRGGFTLVELLMVILIISMLIALLIPAVNAARNRAIETSILSQIDTMSNELETLKNTYGKYPPDPNWHIDEIRTWVRGAWPRISATDVDNVALQIQALDEAEVLVLWLGGRWDSGQLRLTGFNKDPRANPFSLGGQRTAPFQFDETRLFDGDSDGFPEYYPPNFRPQESGAFVYFAARPNRTYYLPSTTTLGSYTDPRGVASGFAVPYSFQVVGRFMKDQSYQIICAGIGQEFGNSAPTVERLFPTGQGYTPGDNDNLTSFAKGRLGDSQ
jgi:general secretion pathway protein G